MKTFKRLVLSLVLIFILAAALSLVITRRNEIKVDKGFTYGPATAQVVSITPGTFTTVYYGFPSTYKEVQSFRPDGDVFSESSMTVLPWDWLYVMSNIVFWTGLFVAVLAPITIFWRPKNKKNEVKLDRVDTDSHATSAESRSYTSASKKVKASADTRD